MMKHQLLAIPLLIANVMAYAHTFELSGIIRDFPSTHPDFNRVITGSQSGCVQNVMVNGGAPIASNSASNCAISQLEDWYSDTHPTGFVKSYAITLNNGQNKPGGIYRFKNNRFFPFDRNETKLGKYRKQDFSFDEGRDHNYHFTFEVRFMFAYQAGQTLAVNGNDDIWVFINNQLVIDSGGVHAPTSANRVALQNLASSLGLVEGEIYPLNLFFAERHTLSSSLDIEFGNIIPFSAGSEIGLTEMLAANEKTCLLLDIACDLLNERVVNIWANVDLPRGEGVDDLLNNWVHFYQNFADKPTDNNQLVQVLHNNVKETCSHITENPKVAILPTTQKQAILNFCESGIYNRIEQILWEGWFTHSPTTAGINQILPFLKANFNPGNLIKTQAGRTQPICPWDIPCF